MSMSKKIIRRSVEGATPLAKANKSNQRNGKTASAKVPQPMAGKKGSRVVTAPVTGAERSLPRETSKIATMIAMLRPRDGASIADLTAATGWQSHSVRGAISGAIKKKMGLTIVSAKTSGVRTYRIAG